MRVVEPEGEEGGRSIRVVSPDELSSSYVSLNEADLVAMKKPELFGWEKAWDQAAKQASAAMEQVAQERGSFGRPTAELLWGDPISWSHQLGPREASTALSMVPFAKYLMPSERRFYEEASTEEKNEAMLWESFGVLLWSFGTIWGKGVKPAVKAMSKWRKARSLMEIKPVEEAIEAISTKRGFWKGFDFKQSAQKVLGGKRFGFAKDEAVGLARYAENPTSPVLKVVEYEKGLAGKPMSKAWKDYVKRTSGAAYGGPTPAEEVIKALDYSTLQSKHYASVYRENLKMLGFNMPHAEAVLKAQAGKFFGSEAAKHIKFATLSLDESANLISNMLAPEGQKFLRAVHTLGSDRYILPWFNPVRSVMGAGESVWGTMSKVFEPLRQIKLNVGTYKTNKMVTFLKMLDERGFGKLTVKDGIPKFAANKEVWTKPILEEAASLMRKADTLAEMGRKGLVNKEVAVRTIEESLKRTRESSPVVAQLVDAVYDYHNLLYKDLLTKWLPKVFHSTGLTPRGAALVGQLGGKLGPKIDAVFASSTGLTHLERSSAVKQILAKYRALLKTDGVFALEGKELEKAVGEVGKRLSYGKEFGFPAYLSYYFPRMRQAGAAMETNWSLALAGEAGFMRTRKLPVPQDVITDLSKMIELRTTQMAKQLYFYDDVGKVVEYAKTLPQSWKLHTESVISRAVGRPSVLDEFVANVLQKTPLAGNWDAYRAMRAARVITGMQYSGLLGFRPFAMFRNLTQPYLTVGTDLGGGIFDHVAVAKGTALAATKEHRKYIQSIGAITEYMPDQVVGHMLPGAKGILPSSDSVRDAFMSMFQMSDRWNRYVSGGAAVAKWDGAMSRAGGNMAKFLRKVKLDARQPWVRDQIENLLHLGKTEEAKAAFVKDVISDTQFLYGTLEAPMALGRGGAPRMITSFNSWWMNYGHLIHKWVRTGDASTKVSRMVSFVLSGALVEQGIEWWAGRDRAVATTFLGPFPLGGFGTPPALEPVRKMLAAAGQMREARPDDMEGMERAYEEMVGAMKSSFETFVPGGLQASQLYKAYQEYGTEGLPKAILGRAQDQEFVPFWGLGD
jgi:hypothetical protein